jgi:site-specific DNA-methyltransferase (adenine-specific)
LSKEGCAWDVKIDLKAFWEQVERLAKNDNTSVLHFCNTKFGVDLVNSKPSWFRYDLVWNKERGVSFLSVKKMPMKSHEMIYVFSKKGSYYNRVDEESDKGGYAAVDCGDKMNAHYNKVPKSQGRVNGLRCSLSVVNCKRSSHGSHPTAKPSLLYKWLLERYCPEGGTVLDPTAGSFNSIEAARDLGLTGIGIEKDEKFYQAAVARLGETISHD